MRNPVSNEFILDSCRVGDRDVFQALVIIGCNFNFTDQNSKSPLLLLTSFSHTKSLIEILKSPNLDINITDSEGCTALFIASYKKNAKIMKMLLEVGADPNISTNDGQTPLSIACAFGNINGVLALTEREDLKHEYSIEHHPWFLAAQNGFKEILEIFLNKKIFDIDLVDEHGFTALALATQNNHILTTKFLVENKANIHKPNNFLISPIEIATFKKSKEIIEIITKAM